MYKIFVYGTLKRNEGNHGLISRDKANKFIGFTIIEGYTLYGGIIPFALKEENQHIKGEIWLVNESTFLSIRDMELYAGYEEVTENDLIFYTFDRIREYYDFKNIPHIGNEYKKFS